MGRKIFEPAVVWKPLAVATATAFLFSTVITKLAIDWGTDENYSHGVLIPFVIGYIIWLEFGHLRSTPRAPEIRAGLPLILFGMLLLLAGTLGAELFTQRIALIVFLAGTVTYFFGTKIFQKLLVPFALLLIAIPIPEIIFSKIAFPLQILATRLANWGIGLFGIDAVRKGNIIELVPLGQTKIAALEVVEACSGIRSLMTLAALALILAYFTSARRERIRGWFADVFRNPDVWRAAILIVSSVPTALFANAVRVTVTGVITFYFGPQTAEGWQHDAAGWGVFVLALVLLIALNAIIMRFMRSSDVPATDKRGLSESQAGAAVVSNQLVAAFILVILIGGVAINWLARRPESQVDRRPLAAFPIRIGDCVMKGRDIRFDAPTENILRTSEYLMRDYLSVSYELTLWRKFNLYVGYYGSQRTGATYHSPQNCLPGAGWEMIDNGLVEINTPAGRDFFAKSYIVKQGDRREVMIYWYQGRGRVNSSEYWDKVYTVLDSVLSHRSDGAMVRIMTPAGDDDEKALKSAVIFAADTADQLSDFVPN